MPPRGHSIIETSAALVRFARVRLDVLRAGHRRQGCFAPAWPRDPDPLTGDAGSRGVGVVDEPHAAIATAQHLATPADGNGNVRWLFSVVVASRVSSTPVVRCGTGLGLDVPIHNGGVTP